MNDERSTILVVEDDRPTRVFLADNLAADGYEPLAAANAREALRLMETRYPDLAIVDLGLPDRDGLEVLRRGARRRRRREPHRPAAAAARAERTRGRAAPPAQLRPRRGRRAAEAVQLSGAEGAHRARCCAATSSRLLHGRLRVGPLEVDPAARTVTLRGRHVRVSQKEFALLRTLATDPTRVFTKEELLRNIWGYTNLGSTRTLDSHACRLRQKLARDGERFVVNVWGVGYRLVDGPVGER